MFKQQTNVLKKSVLKSLETVNNISAPKNGAGALYLPSDLKSLTVITKKNTLGPFTGLRYFWKTYLKTISFYNQNLQIIVNNINVFPKNADGTPKALTKEELKKYKNDPVLNEKCPAKIVLEYTNDKKIELDCKGKKAEEILSDLQSSVKCQQVPESDIVKFGPVH